LSIPADAQLYYIAHDKSTRVKAAGLKTVEETMRLAGISSITVPANILQELASRADAEMMRPEYSVILRGTKTVQDAPKQVSYINNKALYQEDFAKSCSGDALPRMKQVCL